MGQILPSIWNSPTIPGDPSPGLEDDACIMICTLGGCLRREDLVAFDQSYGTAFFEPEKEANSGFNDNLKLLIKTAE